MADTASTRRLQQSGAAKGIQKTTIHYSVVVAILHPIQQMHSNIRGHMKHFIRFIFASLILVTPTQAQTPEIKEDTVTLSRQTLSQIKRDPDGYVERAIRQLFQITASGVLTNDILDTREVMQAAQARSRILNQLFIFDLNTNLALEADEISRQMPLLDSGKKTLLKSVLATSDSDQDGALSLAEILAYAQKKSGAANRNITAARELMAFDIDDDGKVTPEEIGKAISNLVASGYLDNLSPARVPGIQLGGAKVDVSCNFPTPSSNAEIVLVGGYEGAAVSTVAVSGLDRETSLAVLEIEKGDTPLYIVTTAYDSIVWKLEGDVGRVERFVAGAGPRGVGVVGLERKTVHFTPGKGCIPRYYKDSTSGGALRAKGQISAKLKRTVDHVFGSYRLGSIALPSGTQKEELRRGARGGTIVIQGDKRYLLTADGPKLLDGPSKDAGANLELRMLRNLHRYYPGGIVEVDVKDVIASSKAQKYDVLPQQAGLLQLVREGSVTLTSDGYYLITKPIARFPAGLNGGHSVKFMIAKGVDIPAGSPGHSEVILEETGECIAGSRCR